MSNRDTIDPQTRVTRMPDVVFQRLDDELLAVDGQAGICYSLNESAGRVWDLIETPASLDAICAELGREYEVDAETCLREVTAVLHQLHTAKLIQLEDHVSP